MKYITLIVLFFVLPTFAEFNRNSGLIDIPSGRILPHLSYRIGFDGSIVLGAGTRNDEGDVNIHSSLGLFNNFETYFDIYTFNDFTAAFGFSHKIYRTEKFALAWGIHQISYALDISEIGHGDSTGWYDDCTYYHEDYEKPFELGSAFIISTYALNKSVAITFGIGRGRYCGYGTHSQYFNSNFYHEKGGHWGIGLIAGLDWEITKDFSFIIEGDSRDLNTGFKFRYNPIEIGLAITKWEFFVWSGSGEYDPRLSASISYVKIKEPPKPGMIAGTVFDTHGVPLTAKVSFLEKDILPAITKSETGTFVFVDLNPGNYKIYALAKGYEGQGKEIKVSSGKTTYCDFELEDEKPKFGDIIGRVIDMKTGEPVFAHVSIDIIDESVESGETGNFAFEGLEPRIYQITAEADGYENGYYTTKVYAGEKIKCEIKMVKIGMKISLENIKFDFNKATLKPESELVLDEIATFLIDNPDIRMEIQGHTDALGSDEYNLKLSDARANSVREYLIESQNIVPSRLLARGYGESSPVASNQTDQGRAQNRRVDFLILE